MARPKATIPTERLCVTLPAGEVKHAKQAAAEAGVTWSDFVRQALLSQAAIEHGPRRQHVRFTEAPSMERLGIKRSLDTKPEGCVHAWVNKGWAVVCSKCQEVKG